MIACLYELGFDGNEWECPEPHRDVSGSAGSVAGSPGEKAPAFAKLGASERAALLRACMPHLARVSRAWVEAACKAKGHDVNSPAASEEWLGGPMVTMRALRLYVAALEEIHRLGKPQLPAGAFRSGWDGRTEVRVFPYEPIDKAMFGGFSCNLRIQRGLTEMTVRERQASHYSDKNAHGGISLILGRATSPRSRRPMPCTS